MGKVPLDDERARPRLGETRRVGRLQKPRIDRSRLSGCDAEFPVERQRPVRKDITLAVHRHLRQADGSVHRDVRRRGRVEGRGIARPHRPGRFGTAHRPVEPRQPITIRGIGQPRIVGREDRHRTHHGQSNHFSHIRTSFSIRQAAPTRTARCV